VIADPLGPASVRGIPLTCYGTLRLECEGNLHEYSVKADRAACRVRLGLP
jgi:hypothetical protein